ncbi:DUF4268 domain-containing protein [Planctomycetota bacterium]
METNFGAFKKVSIQTAWPHEQYNFTPWLAEDKNMALLAQAIGLELEVENIEVQVGPYSADILAKDAGSDKYVIIENQFGKTNHDHLGKLITYGAFFNAAAVVWLCEDFTEEHRKALDWLNDNTSEDVSFYGVVLELWQIDDSLPAVRFNVASRPNTMVRTATSAKHAGQLTETKRLQLDFWTEFRNRLLAKKVVSSAQTPRPQYWFDVALGRSNMYLSNIANTYEGRIGVRVYLNGKVADMVLEQLAPNRDEIEAELGETLLWNPNPDNKDKTIALYRDADLNNRQQWPEYCDWLVDQVAKFRKVFCPRIKKLVLINTKDGKG